MPTGNNSWPRKLPAPLSIKAQAKQIGSFIWENFAKQRKCRPDQVKIMASMYHLWEEVYNRNSDEPTVLICWNGETARGEYEGGSRVGLHRVDRSWTIVILRGHGFQNLMPNPDANPEIREEDFYDSVEALRDTVRLLVGVSEELPVNYRSTTAMSGIPGMGSNANVFIDGFQISIQTANDVPSIVQST